MVSSDHHTNRELDMTQEVKRFEVGQKYREDRFPSDTMTVVKRTAKGFLRVSTCPHSPDYTHLAKIRVVDYGSGPQEVIQLSIGLNGPAFYASAKVEEVA